MMVRLPMAAGVFAVLAASAFAGERTLVELDFAHEQEGAVLEKRAPTEGVLHGFSSVATSPGKSATVRNGAAWFEKSGRADNRPAAYLDLGGMDKGVLRVTWTMTMERYARGPSKPKTETLFTTRILNRNGQLFFHVACLGNDERADFGLIVASGAPKAIGEWKAGKPVRVEVVLDLNTDTAGVSIDGKACVSDLSVNRPDLAKYVQFGDGTGIGTQDGDFATCVSDVKVTFADQPDKLLERYRRTPPLDAPAPHLNPKAAEPKTWTVPGEVLTSWLGNTFGGAVGKDGYQNGFGNWVQNGIAPGAFAVTPDGSVVAGVGWDEAGRCIGLYKDGAVNTRLVAQYDMRGGHGCWGFGSANNAVAADGEWLYACNHAGHLMRFRWSPGELDSHHWVDQLELGKDCVARSLAACDGKVAALFGSGEVRVWQMSATGFVPTGRWPAPAGAKTMCSASDGGLWFVTSETVVKVGASGGAVSGAMIRDAGSPSAVSLAPDGTLVVCDNGPRQQVRFYDVSGTVPKFVKTFGDEGGLRSGIPGTPGPRKLYGLMGAGKDKRGNLYVGCSLHASSRGTAFKAFDPEGKPLWNLECHAFTDGYSFDPSADGTEVVGVDELISLDLAKPAGQEWSLKALTLDPIRYPKDPRVTAEGHAACAGMLRILEGKRLLYTIGMQAGGISFYGFEEGSGHVAYSAGGVGDRGGFAWSVDAKGDIWQGDTGANTMKRYRFQKWEAGKPVFITESTDSWPVPKGLRQICRIHYDNASDTLYLGAFPDGVPDPAWGMIGSVLERYDGWITGKREKRWRADMPKDDEKLYPKAMDIAGDYAFVVAVKPAAGRAGLISVFRLADGSPVGQIWPGREVGGCSGWVDITNGINVLKRRDGEYLIMVEEDFRGKNILYRWNPGTAARSRQ